MVSTLIGYRLYAGNISKSLERLESTATVKRDAEYYSSHIGKIATVDEFLNDYRLYSYAMKAYGLEDQIASKGLIRKVLESDLGDTASFANKLTDKKYRDFAAAFNFGTDASSETKVAQSTAQTESLVDSYSERRVRQGTAAAAKTNYYQANIGAAKTVDDILNNTALYDVVLDSIGVDSKNISKDFVRQALTGTLPAGTSVTNAGWFTLDDAFNFNADGTLKSGKTSAQDAGAANALINRYNVSTGNTANSYAAAFETNYVTGTFASLGKMEKGLLPTDKRVFEYVATALGFEASKETGAYFFNILASDASDPNSAYAQLMASSTATDIRKQRFTTLRSIFGINANGTQQTGDAGAAERQTRLTDAYFVNYKRLASEADDKKTSTFKFLMANVNSVTDLLRKDDAFGRDALDYALQAFDIDPAETDLVEIRRVLTSDVSDPNSYVRRMKDERFETFAAAFNFGADGKAASRRLVQSTTAQTTTGTKYLASFGASVSTAAKEVIRADTKAYLTAVNGMTSLDDLLADEKSLKFALKAYGLDKADLDAADIRKIVTSDLADRKSFANASADKNYVAFAKAFNFTTSGTIKLEEAGAQSGAAKLTTASEYLLQSLESKASDEGQEGVRLGLYFLRKAPGLTSMTGILADKALLETVKTALGLPDGFTQIDTDKQVAILENRLNLDDFKDPKKLDRFVSRFSALYDVQNAETAAASSPILQLFSGSSSGTGILGLF